MRKHIPILRGEVAEKKEVKDAAQEAKIKKLLDEQRARAEKVEAKAAEHRRKMKEIDEMVQFGGPELRRKIDSFDEGIVEEMRNLRAEGHDSDNDEKKEDEDYEELDD